MSIIFVRHGETPLNVARTLQPAGTPLSANGAAQARSVALRLAALGIARIVSSDLPRALQTAQAIAAASGVAVESSALLQERNFGDLRGRLYDELGFDPLRMDDAPPGGESAQAFRERVAHAFAHAVRLRAGMPGPLAVITHGLVIRAIIESHLTLAPGQVVPAQVRNTSLTIVAVPPPHAAELIDCTSHLDATFRHDARSLSGG